MGMLEAEFGRMAVLQTIVVIETRAILHAPILKEKSSCVLRA